jgi:hypothetical protein
MGEMINAYSVLMESLKGRDHTKHLGTEMRLILQWNLGIQG